MNTCDTCKWWGERQEKGGGTAVWCEMRFCRHPKLDSNEDLDGADVSSIDGYGDIETGPKFGCIHHEPK